MQRPDPAGEPSARYLSRPEAAGYLRVSQRTLDTLTAAGDPPAIRLGARIVFDRGDLDAFMARRKRSGDAVDVREV